MLRNLIFITLLLFYFTSLKAQSCVGTGAIALPDDDITEALIEEGVYEEGGCTPVTSPNPYIESTCIASITRYLARSINMEDLALLIVDEPCYQLPNSPTGEVNCNAPYNACYAQFYCPSKYAENIKMLVDLNASFIVRSVKVWGQEVQFIPGTNLWDAIPRMVCDINAAYDCAGLRRPIIQAGIYENPESGVNYIQIPSSVIDAFRNKTGFESSYYLNPNGTPKTINFKRTRMYHNNDTTTYGDITKIEFRMWGYYQAITYLDAGYNAIHMGCVACWDAAEKASNGYDITYEYFQMIRSYATSIGSFVILNGENPPGNYNLKYNNQLLFDFDGRAMRPREITSPRPYGDWGCNTAYDAGITIPSNCNSSTKALIDTCVIFSEGRNASGTSPLGCSYTQVPYFIYYDFGAGIPENATPGTVSYYGSSQIDGTWGYDDARWFGDELTTNCRKDWWTYFYPKVRNFHNSQSFLQAPGILIVKTPDDGTCDVSPICEGRYMMVDEPAFVSAVDQLWQVNTPTIQLQTSYCDNFVGLCGGLSNHKYLHTYTFSVGNSDATSVYSWHIQKGTQWQPITYGTQRVFAPTSEGTYTVYLRQDNLGLSPGNYGSYTTSININVSSPCCITELNSGESFDRNNPKNSEELTFDSPNELKKDEYPHSISKVYPNPTRDAIKIEYKLLVTDYVNIYVINNLGQVLKIVKNNDLNIKGEYIENIDMAQIPPGIYFIKIAIGAEIYVHKIIKQ